MPSCFQDFLRNIDELNTKCLFQVYELPQARDRGGEQSYLKGNFFNEGEEFLKHLRNENKIPIYLLEYLHKCPLRHPRSSSFA